MSYKDHTCQECGDRRSQIYTHLEICVHAEGKKRGDFKVTNIACKFFHSWEEWNKKWLAEKSNQRPCRAYSDSSGPFAHNGEAGTSVR